MHDHTVWGLIGMLRGEEMSQPDGGRRHFVSGYSNAVLPNLWDRSAEVRARLAATEAA